jgi:hypothetical protein
MNLILGIVCLVSQAQVQQDSSHLPLPHSAPFDSAYYRSYVRKVTGRVFLSRKYTSLSIAEPGGTLKYRPNTPPNIGIGVTYRVLTLNVAAGLGFFTPSDNGKTHSLDLQSHLYFRKVSVDLFGQFYHGYYLPNSAFSGKPDLDYTRPDLHVSFVGASAYYVFNYRRFSYRASLVEDEWQTHSAGSPLLGFEVYYGALGADSALAPSLIAADSSGRFIHAAHFFKTGPGVGYAYTLVWNRHYFLTGGATLAGALGYTREYGVGQYDRFGFTPNVAYRAAVGYNGSLWNVNVSWVNSQAFFTGANAASAYQVKTGLYRLTVARRFGLNARTRRKINAIPQKVKDAITP